MSAYSPPRSYVLSHYSASVAVACLVASHLATTPPAGTGGAERMDGTLAAIPAGSRKTVGGGGAGCVFDEFLLPPAGALNLPHPRPSCVVDGDPRPQSQGKTLALARPIGMPMTAHPETRRRV